MGLDFLDEGLEVVMYGDSVVIDHELKVPSVNNRFFDPDVEE